MTVQDMIIKLAESVLEQGGFRVRYACFILECARLSPKPS